MREHVANICTIQVAISYHYDCSMYIANSKPSAKKLQRYVIPNVATKWYELGVELLDEKEECNLNIIESNCGKDVKKSCLEMFRLWLSTNPDASWWQIMEALKSPGVDLSSVAVELEKKLSGS